MNQKDLVYFYLWFPKVLKINLCLESIIFLLLIFAWKKFLSYFSDYSWALCPTGYYLNGLRLGAGLPAYLDQIVEGQCCHPQDHPNRYDDCYDENVQTSFNNKGWSTCKRKYYLMTGFYRNSYCTRISCIQYLRCCRMAEKGNFIQL